MTISITLSWPSSALSGHNTGHWRGKAALIKSMRNEAHYAAHKAVRGAIIPAGDIHLKVTFFPPDNRGDRLNYPNRMKPYYDGIATGLCVNDKRFSIPVYVANEPSKKPKVVVEFLNICLRTEHESCIDDLRPDGVLEAPARPKSNPLKTYERSEK